MPTSDIKLSSEPLEATGGEPIRLDDFVGSPVVIYFYPRDNTPGCTKEGEAFRDHHGQFAELGCRILGVSRDSLKSHEKFADKHDFPFPLIADPGETLCRQFDVIKEKNMYGKKVMGIERSTFLFDETGRLAREWRKVRVPGHVEEVLDAVRELD
jgi:peroxiredoxin Q/BCP